MRIASWNINSLRRRQDRLLAWLEASAPDIVCLQETKCTDEQFPELALRGAGYFAVFHGQKSYNGVAILSRTEPRAVRIGMGDAEADDQARVISAEVGDARVFSIYAPNGQAVGSTAYQYKLRWFQRLTARLQEESRGLARTLVCGDFNVAPADADVHDPALWHGAIMCSEPERAAFRALEGLGLADSLRLLHPEPGLYSWWDYRMLAFPKNRGLRIDAILAGSELSAELTGAGIDREMRKGPEPSDHAPVWAEFGR